MAGTVLEPSPVPRQSTRQAPPTSLAGWVAEPRPPAQVGIYRYGYERLDLTEAGEPPRPAGPLLLRAAANVVVGLIAYRYGTPAVMYTVGYLGWFRALSPDQFNVVESLINLLLLFLFILLFGRMGRWLEVFRRFLSPVGFRRNVLPLLSKAVTEDRPKGDAPASATTPPSVVDPWAELRQGGLGKALAMVEEDTWAGRVSDVDYVRIHRVWREVLAEPGLVGAFGEQVAVRGAAACAHPSEARDLPARVAEHDLLVGQVRLGTAQDVPKNSAAHRGAGFALDREVLATSLLAVGPAGTGKTARLARPVAEALCLQALARTACVVVVGAAEAELGPDAGYDVVIAPGDPGSAYGLDLYGAASDQDAAAARLADALLPDELSARAQSARTALQQVVGPFHAGYGRYPGVRELRALLVGEEESWDRLVAELAARELLALHEPDVQHRRARQGRADDPGVLLADRLALLDRPAFAGCFEPTGPGAKPAFAMRALEHPLRVRVKLPERGHPEAARILSRLVVGQFLQAAVAREDRSLFAGLVVDDASAALDAGTVQGLRRLPGANAGAVLLLRSLVDLPEALRVPLFGAVGCRMAFPGIAPWDGKLFSEAWGTVLVRERAVTLAPDTSGGMLRKAGRLARKALSGTTAQTESVTTREVERERWSPSDLAHALPGGHAVVSLTAVGGEQVPPLLVDLRA
ncbi:ATP-binding protein [Kitasatospora sp. NBC_01287]|uniref:ATP-binding protein n=1 Tax=Kitasatospora sp. NBC_01287 TaxID=2903573 RepID=UPI0022512ECE|nr:ATP-binding protein [Kitasatospora sp. NBC_01287]MCX4746423.1 ATP-binding protein [Kitasatospora sp. NBC_01287]